MNNLMTVLGQNIQYIRKSKGLTQEELAEKCEMQTSYIAGVERATRNITIQTLEKIISGLEILPEDVFDLTQFLKKETLNKSILLSELEYKLKKCNDKELKLINKIIDDIQEVFSSEN